MSDLSDNSDFEEVPINKKKINYNLNKKGIILYYIIIYNIKLLINYKLITN